MENIPIILKVTVKNKNIYANMKISWIYNDDNHILTFQWFASFILCLAEFAIKHKNIQKIYAEKENFILRFYNCISILFIAFIGYFSVLNIYDLVIFPISKSVIKRYGLLWKKLTCCM